MVSWSNRINNELGDTINGNRKELVRMASCQIFEKHIKNRKDFHNVYFYNNKAKEITKVKAEKEVLCFASVFFKGCPEDSLALIAVLLRTITSTRSEQMDMNIQEYYGWQEIIIS